MGSDYRQKGLKSEKDLKITVRSQNHKKIKLHKCLNHGKVSKAYKGLK